MATPDHDNDRLYQELEEMTRRISEGSQSILNQSNRRLRKALYKRGIVWGKLPKS